MVDYLADLAGEQPLAVDWTQRAVGVSFPADAPLAYHPQETVELALSSWSFSAPGDVRDEAVTVSLDGDVLGTFPMDSTVGSEPFDETGQARVSVQLPVLRPGTYTLEVAGATTGTTALVPIRVGGRRR
jgi:5'-nucleotidase